MLSLRQQTQFLWQTYFSSIDKIVQTTLQVDTPMDSHGFTWTHMDSHGLTWTHMDNMDSHGHYGLTWIHMDSHGLSWTHMDTMDSHGHYELPWTHMDTMDSIECNSRTFCKTHCNTAVLCSLKWIQDSQLMHFTFPSDILGFCTKDDTVHYIPLNDLQLSENVKFHD